MAACPSQSARGVPHCHSIAQPQLPRPRCSRLSAGCGASPPPPCGIERHPPARWACDVTPPASDATCSPARACVPPGARLPRTSDLRSRWQSPSIPDRDPPHSHPAPAPRTCRYECTRPTNGGESGLSTRWDSAGSRPHACTSTCTYVSTWNSHTQFTCAYVVKVVVGCGHALRTRTGACAYTRMLIRTRMLLMRDALRLHDSDALVSECTRVAPCLPPAPHALYHDHRLPLTPHLRHATWAMHVL